MRPALTLAKRPKKNTILKKIIRAKKVWFYYGVIAGLTGILGFTFGQILHFGVYFFGNLFFHYQFSLSNPFSDLSIFSSPVFFWQPLLGTLIIGIFASRIEPGMMGHGLPEIIQNARFNKSVVNPKMLWLRPLLTSLSIGSGGPFGLEGPVLGLGGTVGSNVAQFFKLTHATRFTLLTAGAISGIASVFGTPIGAFMLVIELFAIKLKAKSLFMMITALSMSQVLRYYFYKDSALFLTDLHLNITTTNAVLTLGLGLFIGVFSFAVRFSVVGLEKFFQNSRLPLWSWPLFGGVMVSLFGSLYPITLGPSYNLIEDLLKFKMAPDSVHMELLGVLFLLCAVKTFMWIAAVGSKTVGGTLAPLIIIGGGVGLGYAFLVHNFMPLSSEQILLMILLGMGTLFGAVLHVPLASMILIMEVTGTYQLVSYFLIATAFSFGTSYACDRLSLNEHSIGEDRLLKLRRRDLEDKVESVNGKKKAS